MPSPGGFREDFAGKGRERQISDSSEKRLAKRQKICYDKITIKSCARDSPFDRTATCFCKVPKAERWAKKTESKSPSDDGLFLRLFAEYFFQEVLL